MNVELVNKIHALLPTDFLEINNVIWDIENNELSMGFMTEYVREHVCDVSCSFRLKSAILSCLNDKYFVFCVYQLAKAQQITDEALPLDRKEEVLGNDGNSFEKDNWRESIESYFELIEEEKNDKEFFELRNNIWKTYQDYLRNPQRITVYNAYDDFPCSVNEEPLDDVGNFMNYYCILFGNSETFFPLNIFTIVKKLFNVWEKLRIGKIRESYGKQLPFNGD